MKDVKLYRVQIGRADRHGDTHNWMSRTVIAGDVPGAIRKTKLAPREYVEEVTLVSRVDVQ